MTIQDIVDWSHHTLKSLASLAELVVEFSKTMADDLATAAKFLQDAFANYDKFLKEAKNVRKAKTPRQAYV